MVSAPEVNSLMYLSRIGGRCYTRRPDDSADELAVAASWFWVGDLGPGGGGAPRGGCDGARGSPYLGWLG